MPPCGPGRLLYGKDFQEVDRDWRLYIMRYQGDAAADTLPDTGTPMPGPEGQ